MMNKESRKTFTLLADLTTFIHVVDLVRIDFSHYSPTITFIELKSGKVNEILLSQLKDYSLDENSLNKIENDYEIDKRHKDQARRILRQKIRISQIKKILETDSGTDIKFKMPLNLSNKELEFEFYDSILNQLCKKAVSNGLASANVGYCIHLGAGYSKDKNTAKQNAMIALEQGSSNYTALTTKILTDVSNEINSLISENELYKTYNPFLSNLKSVGCKPFVLWEINRDHLMSLVTEKMCIFTSFDITSFIWIGRKIGFEIGLTGRKEITPYLQKFGSHSIPTWSNRGIIYKGKKGKVVILSGLFQRIICDLVNPAIYLQQIYKINFP